jgi:TPP-dependent pyruvate/acetoin dehydrogenase alpha subunit
MNFRLQSQQHPSEDETHPMKKREVKPGVAITPPGDGEFSLIPHNKLLELYAAMLKCRMIADAISKGKKSARRKRSALISEAVTVGVTIDLQAGDAISPTAFDLTPCAFRGIALKTLLRWWANPSARVPRVISHANVISPAASTTARLEAALRMAAHFRSTNSGSVVVFFTGPDTLRSKPAFSPTLSRERLRSFLLRAAAGRLPILFVRQGNPDGDDFLPISEQCGVPGMVVDCDDVVAVYRIASETLAHARRGNGPTLIDSKPWQLNDRGRKTRKLRDSIGKMELYLSEKGLAYKSIKKRIGKEFAAELGRATEILPKMKKNSF